MTAMTDPEREHARCGRAALDGCDLAIDVDRKWIPPRSEVHHLATINNSRTRHAFAGDHVLEEDHLLTPKTDHADGRAS